MKKLAEDHLHKQAVLNVLFEQDRAHMTVEQIYGYAKKQSSRISIATVYKTVSFLEQENVWYIGRLRYAFAF